MSVVRRIGANAGWLALLGLLCAGAALLVTASPRLANRYTDQGLREWITSLPYLARDLNYAAEMGVAIPDVLGGDVVRPATADGVLTELYQALPPELRERVGGQWYSSQVMAPATGPDFAGLETEAVNLTLRDQSGAADGASMVDGRWPEDPVTFTQVEVAVSATVAATFQLQVGSTVDLLAGDTGRDVPLLVVGIFVPRDRAAPVWDEQPEAFEPYAPSASDPPDPWRAVIFSDTRGLAYASQALGRAELTWRFRIDEAMLTAADIGPVAAAVRDTRYQQVVPATMTTSLGSALARFGARADSARALLAVVQTGVAATLFGLVLLAAYSAGQRRHGEFALLRSRGASLYRIGGRLLVESAPVVLFAVAAGYLVGERVPGRPGGTEWLAATFGVAAVLTAPALAMVAHRRVSVTGARTDLARHRVSPRRVTAELTLAAVAAVGVLLLRRRGLGSDVDIYLAALPVLLATAAAVLALRLLPFPLRFGSAAASRGRGVVGFLGLARAGRSAPSSVGPVAVLVVAVSVGTFCAAVSGSVSAARDRVADLAVPGDAFVTGDRFLPSAGAEIAALPGVTAVVPVLFGRDSLAGGEHVSLAITNVTVLLVDAPALQQVLRASGSGQLLPEALVTATRGEGDVVPAVISPDLADALAGDSEAALSPAELGTSGVSLQGRTVSFTVAQVVPAVAGLGGYDRFVALPWQALAPREAQLFLPNSFAIAGDGLDPAALAAAGDEAQRAWLSEVLGRPYEGQLRVPTRVQTRDGVRVELEQGGVDRVLGYTFAVGLGAGLLLALLAVGFAVASGARSRGQALSRLRTMGLAPGQGRRLLAAEMLPLIMLGALVGAAVGAALPVLLGPALGLSAFSDGGEVVFALDPLVPGLAFGLVLVAVAVAVLVEATMNRRARLGAVLRVGGESA